VLRGHPLDAADRRIVEAFAAQAVVALRQERLADEAEAARPLAEADRMRTALLAAVSHDLRGPLASAKAAITSLRSAEVTFSDHDRDELLVTAEESLDRLSGLVANLLDMSRLRWCPWPEDDRRGVEEMHRGPSMSRKTRSSCSDALPPGPSGRPGGRRGCSSGSW
jgi:K+-sensing histidine kinase KdpD